jgi:hypothetical protein
LIIRTCQIASPAVIISHVTGPKGNDDWYIGDVGVSWDVSDPQSPISASSGCKPTTITSDTAGTTLTCTATSDGGSTTALLTVKRDATAPTLIVPAAVAVDATSPAGVTVAFAATAADTIDRAPTLQCTPATGTLFAIGTTTVTCRATDEAGNQATASFTVHVRGAPEQLESLAAEVDGVGPGTSFADKVAQARAAIGAGDDATALSILKAFIREVGAQSGKKVAPDTAAALAAAAAQISAVLGG